MFTPWETAHGEAAEMFLAVAPVVALSPADDSVDTNTVILTGDGTILSFGESPHIITKLVHFIPATEPVAGGVECPPPQIVDPLAPTSTVTTSVVPAAGGTTTGDGSYPRGSTVTVQATANAGFFFVNWTFANGLEASLHAEYSFVLTSNTQLTANFRPPSIKLVHSPLLVLLTGGDRAITSEAYAHYRCHGLNVWNEISFVTVGADPGAMFAALERRIAQLEAKLQGQFE